MRHTIVFISALMVSTQAISAMTVYPMEASVGESGSAQIQVESKDHEVQFIRVTGKKIINPGTPQEKEITVDMTEGDTLVITPQKLAVTAGGTRIVRLVAIKPPPQETTWRVYFEGVSENEFDGKKDGVNAADIGVSIIWGVLVHVAPEKMVVSLKYDPATGSIINDGTIRIPVSEIGVCSSADSCTWKKENAIVYPGTSVKLKTVNFREGTQYRMKYFNWINNKYEEVSLIASGRQG